ncbi:type II toxin-antitoxin system YoeB family toxin [Eubacteriales bacterium OttesenSCG-928-A19]|nr:type II toxin-antitoxin system YoeB family toxin [Eubacteriales bacterium OttesenSCG-928-A19]
MRVIFEEDALEQYTKLMTSGDVKSFKKVMTLINDIKKNGLLDGLGHPEKLRYRDDEFSRKINDGDRLVYRLDENSDLIIVSCRGHYDDK